MGKRIVGLHHGNYVHGKYALKACSFCGKSTRNAKYCSNRCQRLEDWEAKKKDIEAGKVNSPLPLRHYLIEKHGHRCSICDNTEWQCKPIPLILDHINGDPYNSKPKNLRMICANCDAQTDTYKGKNKGKGRHLRMERYRSGQSY